MLVSWAVRLARLEVAAFFAVVFDPFAVAFAFAASPSAHHSLTIDLSSDARAFASAPSAMRMRFTVAPSRCG